MDNSNWIEGDIKDASFVNKVVSDYLPDVIIHMVNLMYWASSNDPRMALEVNVLGFSNVLEAAKEYGVRRVVAASSGGVYEGSSQECNEGAEISPNVSLYGACRFLNEVLSRQYRENYGIECTNLRCVTVYGPGEIGGQGIAQEVKKIESIASGKTVKVKRLKSCGVFFPIFVADAARAFVLAATTKSRISLVYNISIPKEQYITVGEFVSTIQGLEPGSGDVIFEEDSGPDSVKSFIGHYDTSLAEAELGFKAEYNLKDGLSESIDYVKRSNN